MRSRSTLMAARFQAVSIPPWMVVSLTLLFAAMTFGRGLDWFTADPARLSVVLTSGWLEIRWAGLGLVAGAAALFLAYAVRRHFLVWLAHLHLAFLYAGILLATLDPALRYGDGYSALIAPLGGAVWHTFLWKRIGPRPSAPRGV